MMTKDTMTPLTLFEHVFCYITLGLLCGWYHFIFITTPILLYFAYYGSIIARLLIAIALIFSKTPLTHKPWLLFTRSWIFRVWIKYFDMKFETDLKLHENKEEKGKQKEKYICFEFPHGVFPMGQFLSAHAVEDLWPGEVVCGTGADIIFLFPGMRQIMAWIGTHPATRKNIGRIFSKGYHCAIIPGGIAEMYGINNDTECVYFKKRQNTIKAAIQEGAHIIPAFFFGNTRLFTVINGQGSDSWIARWSRRMRMSLCVFYGRHYLPVPYRHPLKMVTGEVVRVVQRDNPTEEEITGVQQRVIEAVEKLYKLKKPNWETRPLVIS
mmetsp:Transcript_36053/g.36740  ORF Transcript_36053/g.36740 Transcript_36053/m.36740 type:complete len:324 (+) Transcript_36053:127-1098(+)